LRARDERRSREQAARCIAPRSVFGDRLDIVGDRWPFMKTRKEREKPQKMAFVISMLLNMAATAADWLRLA
jgi:hypothetical protein